MAASLCINPGADLLTSRARILKLLMSPRIDSKESISPAYVAWQAGTTTLFLLAVPSTHRLFKFQQRLHAQAGGIDSLELILGLL